MSNQSAPSGLATLAVVYFCFLLLAASSYGDPFPFMGKIFTGRGGELLVLADALCSLYLLLGILKRQLLTWWLLLFYNLLDIVNALVNLTLIPPQALEATAGVSIPQEALLFNTLAAIAAILLLNLFIYRRRHLFVNRSPYLF